MNRTAARNATIAIVNGAVYDGTAPDLQVATTVLVDRGRITDVGPEAALRLPDHAEILDAGGCTVLPGLIDLHSHCTFQYHFENPVTRSFRSPRSDVFLALAAVPRLADALMSGQTTIRDCGAIAGIAQDLRLAIEEGVIPGPRLHIAGQIIQPTAGAHPDEPRLVVRADGVDAVRAAVRRQLHRGADFIKVAVNNLEWTQEELEAAVDEAHRRGRKVACHVLLGPSAKMAIAAGVDSLEHPRFLDDDDVATMADKGIALVAAVSGVRDKVPIGESFLEQDALSATLRREIELTLKYSRQIVDEQPAMIERALKAGVMIGAGTDRTGAYGPDRFDDVVRELEVMVELGVPPDRALQAATSIAAEILGPESAIGLISPGCVADILIVDGNPLTDVSALRNVAWVIKDGVLARSPTARRTGGSNTTQTVL